MTDKPTNFKGEPRQTDTLAPENHNREQADGAAQANTVAEEALAHSVSVLGMEDSEKASSSLNPSNVQDLVDHMKQMDNGGTIDMSAYAGKPNHDENVDKYGRESKLDGLKGEGS